MNTWTNTGKNPLPTRKQAEAAKKLERDSSKQVKPLTKKQIGSPLQQLQRARWQETGKLHMIAANIRVLARQYPTMAVDATALCQRIDATVAGINELYEAQKESYYMHHPELRPRRK